MKLTFEKLEGEKVWHVGVDDQHFTSVCSDSLERAMEATLQLVREVESARRKAGAVHVAIKPLGINHR